LSTYKLIRKSLFEADIGYILWLPLNVLIDMRGGIWQEAYKVNEFVEKIQIYLQDIGEYLDEVEDTMIAQAI
jgi:hypothetical protein